LRPYSVEQPIREYFGKQIKTKRKINDSQRLSPLKVDEFWNRLEQVLDLFQNVSGGEKMLGCNTINKGTCLIA